MTHHEYTPASPIVDTHPTSVIAAADTANTDYDDAVRLAAGTGSRGRRAQTETMKLRTLRDGRTVVETAGGTYVVDRTAHTCTCPDHAIRGVRCKHRRRVAIEAALGRIPSAGMRWGVCAVCGTHVPVRLDSKGSVCCSTHERAAGELVSDRETGDLLVVTTQTTTRADQYRTTAGKQVAEYDSNRNYGRHEPVIEALYVAALTRQPADEPTPYAFPASRLVRTDGDSTRGRRLLASRHRLAAHRRRQQPQQTNWTDQQSVTQPAGTTA